jgi:hypothetical protein
MRVSLEVVSFLHAFDHIPRVDLDPEEEKARQAEAKEKFQPLLSWLKEQAQDVVRDGSHRIVLS